MSVENKSNKKEWREAYNKKYYQEHKDELLKQTKQYKNNNKEYYKNYQKEWREKNKEYIKQCMGEYYSKNREKLLKQNKENYHKNKKELTKLRWTKEDDKFIKENYPRLNAKKIKKILNNRTEEAIRQRAWGKGIKKEEKWSNDKIEFLKNNYKYLTYKEMGDKLNIKKHQLSYRLKQLNLRKIGSKVIKCDYCGKELKKYISLIKNKKYHYCNTKCMGKNMSIINKGKLIGEKNPMYGKIPSKKTREKIRISLLKVWENKEYRDGVFKKISESLSLKPNKKENILIQLFEQNKLPYKYVGDFKFWIEGRNPDFINVNGQKKIIELFGDYFHSKKFIEKHNRPNISEENTINHYKKYGYSTLVIWEKELKDLNNVLNKTKEFDNDNS